MLVRGHAVQVQATEEFFKLHVPSLYKLELGLPASIDHAEARSFYDCKIRRLFVVMPILPPAEVVDEPIVFEDNRTAEKIEEIDAEVQQEADGSDLLFDII